jgi:hypothetical protein
MAVTGDFLTGFVLGVLITVLLGWFWLLYRDWVRAANAYNRPQLVLQPTPKTPAQVRRASAQAELKIMLLRVGLIIVVWLIIEIMFPAAAQSIRSFIGGLWRLFFGT